MAAAEAVRRDAVPGLELSLQYAAPRAGLPHRRSIERWVSAAIAAPAHGARPRARTGTPTRRPPRIGTGVREGRRRLRITVRFAGLSEARLLNRRYRGRTGPTNVLSFVYDGPPADSPALARAALAGDIVICPDVVRREAREQAKPVRAHFAHLVVHGVLHLLGFDHERAAEAARMEALEQAILRDLGYPDPYLPRERRYGTT